MFPKRKELSAAIGRAPIVGIRFKLQAQHRATLGVVADGPDKYGGTTGTRVRYPVGAKGGVQGRVEKLNVQHDERVVNEAIF